MVRAREPNFLSDDGGSAVEVLLLGFPDNFFHHQRREHYRVPLPLDHHVRVRMWRIADHAVLRDRPLAAQELFAKLLDLSVGGLGASCRPARDGHPPRVLANERLRVQLSWGQEEILIEARVRHTRLGPNDNVILGAQFQKLDRDVEGRQALAKLGSIVGLVQRDEVRRIAPGRGWGDRPGARRRRRIASNSQTQFRGLLKQRFGDGGVDLVRRSHRVALPRVRGAGAR